MRTRSRRPTGSRSSSEGSARPRPVRCHRSRRVLRREPPCAASGRGALHRWLLLVDGLAARSSPAVRLELCDPQKRVATHSRDLPSGCARTPRRPRLQFPVHRGDADRIRQADARGGVRSAIQHRGRTSAAPPLGVHDDRNQRTRAVAACATRGTRAMGSRPRSRVRRGRARVTTGRTTWARRASAEIARKLASGRIEREKVAHQLVGRGLTGAVASWIGRVRCSDAVRESAMQFHRPQVMLPNRNQLGSRRRGQRASRSGARFMRAMMSATLLRRVCLSLSRTNEARPRGTFTTLSCRPRIMNAAPDAAGREPRERTDSFHASESLTGLRWRAQEGEAQEQVWAPGEGDLRDRSRE